MFTPSQLSLLTCIPESFALFPPCRRGSDAGGRALISGMPQASEAPPVSRSTGLLQALPPSKRRQRKRKPSTTLRSRQVLGTSGSDRHHSTSIRTTHMDRQSYLFCGWIYSPRERDLAETTPVPLLLNQVRVVLGQCSSLPAPQRGRDMQ